MLEAVILLAVGTGVVVIVVTVAIVVVVLAVTASMRGRDRSGAEQRHDARRDVQEAQERGAQQQRDRDTGSE